MPRRFRRRMVGALLLVGLLPVGILGLATRAGLSSVMAISLAPVEGSLARAGEQLAVARGAPDPELAQAQLFLAEAELARKSLVRRAQALFALAVVAAAALAGALAFLLARQFSRPIGALAQGMLRVSRGELASPLPAPADDDDELAFLVARFGAMTAQLRSQRDQLQAAEKLAGFQEAARSLAHELKNPLTAMRMSLARIERAKEREAPGPVTTEAAALLDQELSVLMRLAQSFSELARLPAPRPERVELRAILRDVCGLYAGLSKVPVTLADGPELWVRADRDQLRRVFANLVKNAVEASGPADAGVEVVGAVAGAGVRIEVRDRGEGLPGDAQGADAVLGRTTKAQGSGLGLPIAQALVRAHGGTLLLSRREGPGTVAQVTLPADEVQR